MSKSSSGELSPSNVAYPRSFLSFFSLRRPNSNSSFLLTFSCSPSLTAIVNSKSITFVELNVLFHKMKLINLFIYLQSSSSFFRFADVSDANSPGNSFSTSGSGLSKSIVPNSFSICTYLFAGGVFHFRLYRLRSILLRRKIHNCKKCLYTHTLLLI